MVTVFGQRRDFKVQELMKVVDRQIHSKVSTFVTSILDFFFSVFQWFVSLKVPEPQWTNMTHEPLDLIEIRKEQRRVAALLNVNSNGYDMSFREKNFIPHTYCYWCNRLGVGKKYRNPHRYLFQKGHMCGCEHEPRVPNPTFISERDFHGNGGLQEEIMRDVLQNDGLDDRGSARTRARRKHRNKLAASLPNISETSTSLVSRNTGMHGSSTRVQKDSFDSFTLPSLSQDTTTNKSSLRRQMGVDNGLSDKNTDGLQETRHMKYHHKEPEERLEKFAVLIKKGRSSREPSFEIRRSISTLSRTSEESFRFNDSSFHVTQLKSVSWCQCSDISIDSYQCYECSQTGGLHTGSCTFYRSTSTIGKCGACEKLIKKVRTTSRESTSLSNSFVRQLTPSSTKRSMESRKDSKRTRSFRTESTDEYIKKINEKFTGGTYDFDTDLDVNKINTGLKFASSVTQDTAPKTDIEKQNIVDPNIHRDAYIRALKDARYRKFKTSKSHDHHDRLVQPFVFSYYDMLPWLPSNTKLDTRFGIREDERPRVKKGMRHIFGKVKVEDYYPGGKMFKPLPTLPKVGADKQMIAVKK